MKERRNHTAVGLSFIGVCIVVAMAIYLGIKLGGTKPTINSQREAATTSPLPTPTEAPAPEIQTPDNTVIDVRVNPYDRDNDDKSIAQLVESEHFKSCIPTGKEELIAEEKLIMQVLCSQSADQKNPFRSGALSTIPPRLYGRYAEDCAKDGVNTLDISKDGMVFYETYLEISSLRQNGMNSFKVVGMLKDMTDDTAQPNPWSVQINMLNNDGEMFINDNGDGHRYLRCPSGSES